MTQKPDILVAMSGGVDSSVTAALLCQQGYRVQGLYMDMGLAHKQRTDADGREVSDRNDARAVADMLGIPLHVVDFRAEIEQVMAYFVDEYRRGRTPNPCIQCNRRLKFGRILEYADRIGAATIATGHYARVTEQDRHWGLYRAVNRAKDQSYALFGIGYDRLARIRFPLGNYAKNEVRARAQALGLPVHDKDDSQEICFVPNDDYVSFLERLAPDLKQPGPIVDTRGNVLGEHQGIYRYTIGQRRGLGIALGTPAYVTAIDPQTHTVTLGNNDDLLCDTLVAQDLCWTVSPPPSSPFAATVQIRYNHRGAPATVRVDPDTRRAVVRFDTPVRAVTPGQAAVFYRDQQVLGGGWIVGGAPYRNRPDADDTACHDGTGNRL